MEATERQRFRSWMIAGLVMAIAGAALCALVGWQKPEVLWSAYLLGIMTWWPVAVGGLGLVALGNLTGGRWAAAGRPFYLAAAQTLLPLSLLALPLAFGVQHIYSWAETSTEHSSHLFPGKAYYLSPPFFLARAAGYFIVWLLVSFWLALVSRLDRPPASRPGMRRAGALSLVLLVVTATFAAFDWAMSLEPDWYSSIYGAIIIAGGVVAVHALAIIGLVFTTPDTHHQLHVPRPHGTEHWHTVDLYNDLGNLLLAFIMVWTYFSFSQFFIIWSANLPSEIEWYLRRIRDGWQIVALTIVAVCFVLPFALLLSRDLKRSRGKLALVAALLVGGYMLHMYWALVPAFRVQSVASYFASLGAVLGVGGLWILLYWWRLGRFTRVPRHREA